ncbi:hypothetical protein E2C01_067193 [Portunus trituberculatus]|uniref:Uncharacterized protein n=1 Tax=Portunus trituberculatus TaxID=210409 RepID=A0A5B7HKC0_PORTR|nr:hypothetical protein [Portunus trituberculatus]
MTSVVVCGVRQRSFLPWLQHVVSNGWRGVRGPCESGRSVRHCNDARGSWRGIFAFVDLKFTSSEIKISDDYV